VPSWPDTLDADRRAKVEAELDDNFRKAPDPPVVWRRWTHGYVVAAYRAGAMRAEGSPSGTGSLDAVGGADHWLEAAGLRKHWRRNR
jgi:hypothetical protein